MLIKDEIVDIPDNRVKFFGTEGKMLLPCPSTVAKVIATIPAGKIITTGLLREHLTEKFEVEATCPVTIKKALVAIAKDDSNDAPYWRVINQSGKVIANLPASADKLQADGLAIEVDGKKVIDFQAHVAILS